jgi:peptidoglycan/xylan/chitin deacetylase (PgdA/CDA1 family)
MAEKLPILVYHRMHFDDDVTEPNDDGRTDLSLFKRQMRYLKDEGFQTVTYREIEYWLYNDDALPERAVAIDFDDKRLNVLENVLPVLDELGFIATVFVITDLASGNNPSGMAGHPALDWKHLEELRDKGWCISPHTVKHLYLAGPEHLPRDEAELMSELVDSRREVEERLGIDAPNFAYPCGSWDNEVETRVKEVYRTARHWHLVDKGPWPLNTRETNPYRLAAINMCNAMSLETFKDLIDSAK